MPDIADARPDRPLQPGDVVRVVGQDLQWTVLATRGALELSFGILMPTVRLWNDVHGTKDFPPEVLERVS